MRWSPSIESADDTYDQSDFTILDGTSQGQAIAVSDYSEADQTITFANALKLEGEAYVEDGKTTKAIDEDAKIVYIDADNQTKGDDGMGITSFDGTTGYANALIVYEGGVATNKIVAIIVNTRLLIRMCWGMRQLHLRLRLPVQVSIRLLPTTYPLMPRASMLLARK